MFTLRAQDYRRLSPQLRATVARLTEGFREPYVRLTATASSRRLWKCRPTRERDGEPVAKPIPVLGQEDLGVVQFGGVLHDREAETAAIGVGAEQPVEPLEDALPLLDGMTGPSSLTERRAEGSASTRTVTRPPDWL